MVVLNHFHPLSYLSPHRDRNGYRLGCIISRSEVLYEKYAHSQLISTVILFLIPNKEMRCMNIHASHAGNPLKKSLFISTTARFRPIVAIEPLS